MGPLAIGLPTVAVSMIYCLWQKMEMVTQRRKKWRLRERVTYMLWTMAERIN